MAAIQYLVPGGTYLNETVTAQYLLPGGAYVDETAAPTPLTEDGLTFRRIMSARQRPG